MKQLKRPRNLLATAITTLAAVVLPSVAQAEVQLAEADGWRVSTDGRVNAFVSHIFGENRPDSLGSLPWVGYNENPTAGQSNAANEVRKTRIRSGYVPNNVALNLSKQMSESLKVSARVEVGFQAANIKPTEIGADPTWMEPRTVYLDLAGGWGSVRAGRDLGLFGRHNLFLNYELGHAYGVGFPCSYELIYGGSCGHVGFGTIWPDFHAQITYNTPTIGDVLDIGVGVFDPRTYPPGSWHWTPLPRFETEAVASFGGEAFAVKLWGSAFYQKLGTTQDIATTDPATGAVTMEPQDFEQDLFAFAGGLKADIGPFKVGAAAHTGKGIGPFVVLTFNPIALSLGGRPPQEQKFRNITAWLAQAAYTLGTTTLNAGFGQTILDKVDNDPALADVGAIPRLTQQTGISVGLYHRIDNVILGLDYFNADYDFETRLIMDPNTGAVVPEENAQNVNFLNAGVTLEW